MPTSDNDVLDLMNRAAMDAPSMSLAPLSVLASAQNRRRKQRQIRGGMVLAAFAAAGAIWVGSVSGLGDLLGTQVDPAGPTTTEDVEIAVPKEWDDTVPFEELLPQDDTQPLGFRRATLVRDAGEGFTVELPGGGSDRTLEPIDGPLPDGVAVFAHEGDSLIVVEPRYAGIPALDLDQSEDFLSVSGQFINGERDEPFVWLVERSIDPADITDIYWQLPDQVVSSRGVPVTSDVVSVGGDTVKFMLVPSTGRWAQIMDPGLGEIFDAGDLLGAAWEGDLTVAVLPADVSNPVLLSNGAGYDEENAVIEKEVSVPMSSRPIGDFLLAWGTVDSSQFIEGSSPFVSWDGGGFQEVLPPTLDVTETEDGYDVQVAGTQSAISLAEGQTASAAVIGEDGSALAVGRFPEGSARSDGPYGTGDVYPDLVVETNETIQTGYSLATTEGAYPLDLPQSTGMIGVAFSAGLVNDPDARILPTLLFEGARGPQWAGRGEPISVEIDGTTLNVAVEPDVGIWAAGCPSYNANIGRVGSPLVKLVSCGNGADSADDKMQGYVVAVLSTDEAATAQVIAKSEGRAAVEELGDPITAEIGDGLSVWALPLGTAEPSAEGDLLAPIAGIDIDGDGKVDGPSPAN